MGSVRRQERLPAPAGRPTARLTTRSTSGKDTMATAVQTAPSTSSCPVPGAHRPALVERAALVGRERELAVALHHLNPQAGGGIWITGETGVGKTRLAQEIVAASHPAAPRGTRPLPAADRREGPDRGDLPYDPETAAGAASRIECLPAVEVLDAAGPLLRTDARRPRTLWIEDAHLLDAQGAAVVLRIAHRGTHKLLITANADKAAPRLHTLWKDQYLARLDLGPLDTVSARRLAAALMEGRLTRSSVVRLAEMSAGNPMLLRELLRAAIDQGLLSRDGDQWHLGDGIPTSHALRDLVAPGIAALPAPERSALQLIALAEPARLAVLETVVGAATLLRLEDRGLVRAQGHGGCPGAGPVQALAVVHPHLGHVLRQEVAPLRSRHWAQTWAAALDAHGGPLPAERARVVQWQWDTGLAPDEPALLDAARHALHGHELPAAARLATAAWRTHRTALAAELLGQVLLAGADLDELTDFATEAGAGRPDVASRLDPLAARALVLQGRHPEADRLIERLREDERVAARAMAAYFQGRCDRVPTDAVPAVAPPGAAHRTESGLLAMSALCRQGRPLDALEVHRRLQQRGSGGPVASGLCDADWLAEAHAVALMYAGRLEAAETLLTGAYRSAAEEHRVRVDAQRGLALGCALYERGRLREALPYVTFTPAYRVGWPPWQDKARIYAALIGSCLPLHHPQHGPPAEDDTLHGLSAGLHATALALARARLAHRDGDQDTAVRLLDSAVDAALDDGAYGDAVTALHEIARLGLPAHPGALADLPVQGPFLRARLHCARALATGDAGLLGRASHALADCGASLYAAEGYAELARLQRNAGRERAATAATAQARTLLRRCGDVATPPLHFLGDGPSLSVRERTVAALAARGMADKEIAARLVVSPRTVGNTLYRVYRKLGVGDRRDLRRMLSA
ncbi:LuxR C-terminal-related transcriptional regulator [Streptomyces caniferus]|uniref:helix-turn-helix transcriptional regulator n=1 Tax=Streptomyces caniferus TaxID=285557 RepID=UPI003722F8B9